jgi:hypothetical protein
MCHARLLDSISIVVARLAVVLLVGCGVVPGANVTADANVVDTADANVVDTASANIVDHARLRDDFEELPHARWTTTANGAWTGVYTGGELGVENDGGNVLYQRPPISKSSGETHADMVVSSQSLDGELDVQLRIKTVAQLRQGSHPNPWEVAWFGWGYQRAEQFYYFVAKPNGWELGKSDDSQLDPTGPECSWPEYANCRYRGAQRFLATGSAPTFPIGVWYQIHVVQTGPNVKVYVNDALLADVTDDHNVLSWGRLVLYNEDAWARFDDVCVRAADGAGCT